MRSLIHVHVQELGNYGEYSGAPNTNETYQYAKVVLDCVCASGDGVHGRALLIGGGIANFTDVAATFTVCMVVRWAKETRWAALQKAQMSRHKG